MEIALDIFLDGGAGHQAFAIGRLLNPIPQVGICQRLGGDRGSLCVGKERSPSATPRPPSSLAVSRRPLAQLCKRCGGATHLPFSSLAGPNSGIIKLSEGHTQKGQNHDHLRAHPDP